MLVTKVSRATSVAKPEAAHVALVSRPDAEGGTLLRHVRRAFARCRRRRPGAARHARGWRGADEQLPDRDGPGAGRRQRHARGPDRGAPDLHHAVRSRNIRDLITSMDNAIDQMQKTAKSIR